jgi:hypothetical protein
MLETPTFGKYGREERTLTFEAATPYIVFVYLTILFGAWFALTNYLNDHRIYFLTGLAVILAGIWANLSMTRIRFDLRNRTYRRRQGPGIIGQKLWTGTIDEIDAIVVLREDSLRGPRFHIVIYWKQQRCPLMALESEFTANPAKIFAKAQRYSASLRLPLYDNTSFASPSPIPIF